MIEKWEFAACTERSRSIANDQFYSKHNEEIGVFLRKLNTTTPFSNEPFDA
jgi:hypothetical protein